MFFCLVKRLRAKRPKIPAFVKQMQLFTEADPQLACDDTLPTMLPECGVFLPQL